MTLPARRPIAPPRCSRCTDSGRVTVGAYVSGRYYTQTFACSCRSSDDADERYEDSRTEYEIDRAEERASTVFGRTREDWGSR